MMKWLQRTLVLVLSFLLIVTTVPVNVLAEEKSDVFTSESNNYTADIGESTGVDKDVAEIPEEEISATEMEDTASEKDRALLNSNDSNSIDEKVTGESEDINTGKETEDSLLQKEEKTVQLSESSPTAEAQSVQQMKSPVPEDQPTAPDGKTSIWGKNGVSFKLQIISVCTNPDAAHKGGNEKTNKKNYISGEYFTFGEMSFNGNAWEVSAQFNASKYLEEVFEEPHAASEVTLTLEYVNGKWCVQSEEDIAVIRLEGKCESEGPQEPVLGENLNVWVQMYAGEYEPVLGAQIDKNSKKYGRSVTFGQVTNTGEQWTCDMTVVGYTKNGDLGGSYFLNDRMPNGYEVDPYEMDGDVAEKTVTLTYNQDNGTWECPAIPLKHTSHGPGASSKVKYGVSFKVKNIKQEEGVPALPTENPVHNGGFWVSLYAKNNDGTGYEEVYTQVYDGTQDYVTFSAPAEGGILGTYTTTATVDGEKVLDASKLQGYRLSDNKPTKENELIFDWDSMTWTAQTMIPGFDQPDNGIAKRGLAFQVEKLEQEPELPNKDNCTNFYVTVYGEETKNNNTVVNHVLRSMRWDLTDENKVQITFSQPVKNSEGIWTCTAAVKAEEFVEQICDEQSSGNYRRDMTDPTTKEVRLTYNEKTSKWTAENDGVSYGYPSSLSTKNGVAFRLIKQYEITYAPGRDVEFKVVEGKEYSGGVFDKGAPVKLPETTEFAAENGSFSGWKTSIKEGSDTIVYFYPTGTEMIMFGQDVTLEAYWMDIELEVASIPYDSGLDVKDYTFGETADFTVNNGESITLLYRAKVRGNSQYPYSLSCERGTSVYGTELEGTINKYQTSKYVYIAKTYTPEASGSFIENVTMGKVQDAVRANITVKPITYTVSFDANGGSGSMDPVTVEAGKDYKLPECGFTAPEGKRFKAWSVNGEEVAEGTKITVNADVKVTVVWEMIPVFSYTVSFDANGGSGSMDPVNVEACKSYTLPSCKFIAPEGKKFKAWKVDGKELAAGKEITVTSDVKVTAVWESVDSDVSNIKDSSDTINTNKISNNPKTGDSSDFVFWGMSIGTSLLLAAVILIKDKRKNRF